MITLYNYFIYTLEQSELQSVKKKAWEHWICISTVNSIWSGRKVRLAPHIITRVQLENDGGRSSEKQTGIWISDSYGNCFILFHNANMKGMASCGLRWYCNFYCNMIHPWYGCNKYPMPGIIIVPNV